MRSHPRTVAGLCIAAAFRWLDFGRVDWSSIGTVLSQSTPGPLVLGILALAAGFFVRIVRWWTIPHAFVTAAAVLGGVALIAVLVLVLAPGVLRVGADRVTASRVLAHRSWTPRLRESAHRLADAFALVQSPTRALQLLSLSVLAWMLEGAMYACVAWALHVGGSPVAPWFAAATGTLATLIPSSPGYVGTFDYFAILGLTAFGAHRVTATAFAMAVHVVLWLPVTIVGAAFMVKPGTPGIFRRPERQRVNA